MARGLHYDENGNFVGLAPASGGSDLSDMTVAELREYADANGVDLGDATKKADILAALEG